MNRLAAGAAAAALAVAAMLPVPAGASPDRLAQAEREAARLDQHLSALEAAAARQDESASLRAARKFSEGETQYLLGDWQHAALLLTAAVDEPSFKPTKDWPQAVFYLGDAHRRDGACASARVRYAEYLASGATERRGEALTGALDCAVKERRPDLVPGLLAEAHKAFAGDPPPEVRYLAARSLFLRRDLGDERRARVLAAFEDVPQPFRQQAAYHQGVVEIDAGDLPAAAARFEACARAQAVEAKQREVQELCLLALGRVHAELDQAGEAVDWYARVSPESKHFDEALYEIAWAYVKGKQYEAALRTAGTIADLSPDSPLAPEATVLQGHLLLRLGRYAEATEAYSRVINSYAPIRDEIDAILTMHEDPVRYFNELIGRQGKAFDVATVLPPVAVRWAAGNKEVAIALDLVTALDGGRRDVDGAEELAGRIDALLARGNGLDAFPLLQQGYATASALENDAAGLQGLAADALLEAGRPTLEPAARDELDLVHAERLAAERKLASLPRSGEQVLARLGRMRARVDQVDQSAYRLQYELDAANAALSGTEAWLEQHRMEITADPEGRQEFTDDLRTQRETVAEYGDELKRLRADISRARDLAAGAEATDEEGRMREGYLALLARERDLLTRGRGALNAGDIARMDHAIAVADRLAAARKRARAVADALQADAKRRAGELRARVAVEKDAISAEASGLDGVQDQAKELVGRIAYRSFSGVRSQFYRLVLKADLGLVDVAWSRKRVRLEKIQALAQQKSAEIQQLDDDYRDLLREVD